MVQTQMTTIFICAGEATRWNNYGGTPKHYAVLNGEPIIERATRLFREHGAQDLIVVSKEYNIANTTSFRPTLNDSFFDADKFLSSRRLWNDAGRTVVVYGDVYWTDNAVQQVCTYDETELKMFCRPYPSEITGTKWGECFALSFYPEHHQQIFDTLHELIWAYDEGIIGRIGGWELTKRLSGVKLGYLHEDLEQSDLYFVIDDETDDIDFFDDWLRLKGLIG